MTDDTFQHWMALVDRELQRRTAGLASADLPDWNYHAAYHDNTTPPDAAAEVLDWADWTCVSERLRSNEWGRP